MALSEPVDVVYRFAVAIFGGLAVGVEREWSARAGKKIHRFAGVRTFVLLSLIGALAAELSSADFPVAGAILVGAAGLLAVGAYLVHASSHVDGTTEVAAIFVLGAGFLSGLGHITLASALFALVALVLVEKSTLHSFVEKMRTEEIAAGARFAVLALVVLPLLPTGPFGPAPGIRPRELWGIVLVFSGLSFGAYIAMRAFGAQKGHGLAGLLGGLVSSTAVTLQFARRSHEDAAAGVSLGLGAVAASTMMILRVLGITAGFSPALALRAAPLLAFPFAAGAVVSAVLFLRTRSKEAEVGKLPQNPLSFAMALLLAVLFQGVLWGVTLVKEALGSVGLVVSGALLGFTDMDALVYSMVKLGSAPELSADAARALAMGVLSNGVLKLAIAVAVGRGTFRKITALGLAAMIAASAVGLLVL